MRKAPYRIAVLRVGVRRPEQNRRHGLSKGPLTGRKIRSSLWQKSHCHGQSRLDNGGNRPVVIGSVRRRETVTGRQIESPRPGESFLSLDGWKDPLPVAHLRHRVDGVASAGN
mgnify:CR=1 FL=1